MSMGVTVAVGKESLVIRHAANLNVLTSIRHVYLFNVRPFHDYMWDVKNTLHIKIVLFCIVLHIYPFSGVYGYFIRSFFCYIISFFCCIIIWLWPVKPVLKRDKLTPSHAHINDELYLKPKAAVLFVLPVSSAKKDRVRRNRWEIL